MNRDVMVQQLSDPAKVWDLIIVGGGATGLGAAVDAAARGYSVLLLEQHDFAKGTSSRSTKLVHGGVRYLQQGNISLVLEALKERGLLRENAPHLVHDLPFIVPNYDWWEAPFYGIGLRLYDMLAGKHGFGDSRNLSKEKTIEHIPTIETEGLRGGVIYYDGQFDDARLAINLAQTAAEHGATLLNYFGVTGLIKEDDIVRGVEAQNAETGETHTIAAKVVINATGAFTDSLRKMDDPNVRNMISPSQGVHIVLERAFLPGDSAIMVPHTDDGRVLFAIPWHNRTLVGTTDTPVDEATLEPKAQDEEIEFLLKHTARYLTRDPKPEDVLSVFAGIRPLVKGGDDQDTAALSRDHTISISRSGLFTVTGGKWTTYRRMAEDAIDQAATLAQLDDVRCPTHDLRIHGHHEEDSGDALSFYGSDADSIRSLQELTPNGAKPLHPALPYTSPEVIWAARNEMARTVEDVLSRRTRALLLDARASIEIAPAVAQLLAEELGHDAAWEEEQVEHYRSLAAGYILVP